MKKKSNINCTQKILFESLNRKLLFGMLLFSLVFLNACDNFVEVDLPTSQLNTNAVFQDRATANAAMINIYTKMRDAGILSGNVSGMSNQLGNYADELVYFGDISGTTVNFYNNTILPSNGEIFSWWSNSYNQIYAANAIIEGVNASTGLAIADKNQLTGEALFVRSLLHFYLVNLYGNVPYITTTNYEINKVANRTLSAELYSNIIADLELAFSLLPEDYISTDRVRPNKSVAKALLARVYLYNGLWADAANSASYTLNNTAVYAWETDLNKIFLKESTTTIWQFSPRFDGQNTQEGETFVFFSGPPSLVALSEQLLSDFESGDQRKEKWIGPVTNGIDTWFHANKYKEKSITSSSLEYSILFRLAEQYIIRAEARAQQGDLIGAKEDLNKIRTTAGLPETTAISQQDILTAILKERKVEFFTELGHRFFDLKRANKINEVLTPIKPGWNSTDNLMPLPESELSLNPNLNPQNPGY
ncbi:RagB/SusD family nutrient uptake outer membrane protein [Flavobacterium turcicum]|uniref:RagB/SusD family nutrient uptake outer membrane protein n=1 Tax=Flavobacterium turcicum TaxID=2764718 RepID=A0ABR7JEF6_9FLAO|nr:RagB/SusD family nutrient uptake outer membrane protein [Flavobacterium turcicum]MBC5862837.1 RagB/SusD family nutrient uptake outer membrane protein [Flavobacterium turcicum]NHL01569.1 RagB/SusD family nutrient uptake outer membrane protein [Flavobacterium turcicum]